MQSKSTIDSHREISAALDFLRQASADDGAFELDPRVVSGWVEMSLGALEVLVTAKRGKHADDKALGQKIYEHLSHATVHMERAYEACKQDSTSGFNDRTGLDDDQLPHYDHATARVALLYARKAIVEQEAESDRALAQKIKEGANGIMQTTEGIVGIATELYMHRTYPNSCKVEKVEHGNQHGTTGLFVYNPGQDVSVCPTRPIETDNKPGKTEWSCNPLPRGFWTTWTGTMPYYADESVMTYSLLSDAGNGPWTSCIPNGMPLSSYGARPLWGIYTPPSGVAKEGGVAVGVFVNYEPLSTKKTAQCATPKSTPVSSWSMYVDDVKVTELTDVKCEYGSGIPGMDKMPGFVSETTFGTKKTGTWSVDIPLTLAGVPVPKPKSATVQKPDGFTVLKHNQFDRAGYINAVDIHNSPIASVLCVGCSYAKWPNKGPGYSARCDKCKLDPNRPGYVSK